MRQMRHFLFACNISSLDGQIRTPGSKNGKSVAFCHTGSGRNSKFETRNSPRGIAGERLENATPTPQLTALGVEGPEGRYTVAQGASPGLSNFTQCRAPEGATEGLPCFRPLGAEETILRHGLFSIVPPGLAIDDRPRVRDLAGR